MSAVWNSRSDGLPYLQLGFRLQICTVFFFVPRVPRLRCCRYLFSLELKSSSPTPVARVHVQLVTRSILCYAHKLRVGYCSADRASTMTPQRLGVFGALSAHSAFSFRVGLDRRWRATSLPASLIKIFGRPCNS